MTRRDGRLRRSKSPENAVNCHRILRGGLSLSLLLAAAACANAPLADPQQDAEAKRFEPPTGENGALYVYRAGLMGLARPIDVSIAGGASAELASNTYLRLEGPPGPIDLSCKIGDKQGGQQIAIEPGRVRYVEVSLKVGLTLPGCDVTEVSPDQGQAAVRNARRVNSRGP
jgi:hypothetical protein